MTNQRTANGSQEANQAKFELDWFNFNTLVIKVADELTHQVLLLTPREAGELRKLLNDFGLSRGDFLVNIHI